MAQKSYSLQELAQLFCCTLKGDGHHQIESVNTLEEASDCEASFLANPRYEELMKISKAGVICVDNKTSLPEGKNFLVSDNPSRIFQQIAELFLSHKTLSGFTGIHPSAIIHPSAKIGAEVTIGPYAVIDENVVIGEKTFIGSHAYIGPKVAIGKDCILHPSVIIREGCIIKDRVILQPGCVIGSCGFGYTTDKEGNHQKLQQIGNVVIEDDVEIGANTTIDRARFKATVIGKGSKIDNLVQIAHNVEIGRNTAIAAQVGIAGSSKIGNNVLLGGQVGVVGHVEIGNQIMIAAKSGVSKSHLTSGKIGGNPAMDLSQYNRQCVHIRNLDKNAKRILDLEKRLDALENSSSHQ